MNSRDLLAMLVLGLGVSACGTAPKPLAHTAPARAAATTTAAGSSHVPGVQPAVQLAKPSELCAGERISPAMRGALTVFVVHDASQSDASMTSQAPRSRICAETPTQPARVVLSGHAADRPEDMLVQLDNLVLSADAKLIYFSSDAWATSQAAHVVDLDGQNLRFLTDGIVLAELEDGPYAGNLVALHHRLDDAHAFTSIAYRGRVEVFTIIDHKGKLVIKLPDDKSKHAAVLYPKPAKPRR